MDKQPVTDAKPASWDRLQVLFKAALEREVGDRPAFLDESCDDPELRREIDQLLAAHDGADEATVWSASVRPANVPERIGRYRIRSMIASGGMGTVYEAEQENPHRTVALKVVRRVASEAVWRRFEYEADLLAHLHHPGIAQVYEAGAHDDGSGPVPYFVMEYVPEAKTLTEYATAAGLDLRARIELFADVCDAVHHGHQRGIIHRDLKPGNILVGGDGRPKIIDFGVARAADAGIAVTLRTEAGELIGTLQYMSPEQCEADPANIDTRSDVYALGVILYELLGGALPYDVTEKAVFEAMRLVREVEPPRLGAVDPRLRGEVEAIVQKAMEKERDRRYRSAADLADDLRRHLRGEAIQARPPSVAYQLRVFARRHKALVGGVAAVFVTLVLGVIGTLLGLLDAEEARAETEAMLFDMVTSQGLEAGEEGRLGQAFSWFANAPDLGAESAAHRVRLLAWARHAPTPVRVVPHELQNPDVIFHPDGRYLILLDGDRRRPCLIWDLEDEKPLPVPRSPKIATFSADGSLVLRFGRAFEFYSFPDLRHLRTVRHRGPVQPWALTRDGRYLVLGEAERPFTLRTWDIESGRFLATEWDHPEAATSVSFNRAVDRTATTCGSQVHVFAFPGDGQPLFDPLPNDGSRPRFIEGGILTRTSEAELTWWDAETGKKVRSVPFDGSIRGFRAAPGGRHFVLYGSRGAHLWNVARGRMARLEGAGSVSTVSFSRDGEQLVTAGGAGHAARLWSVDNAALLALAPHQDALKRVRHARRGYRFATVSDNDTVRVWRVQAGGARKLPVRGYVALSRDGRYLLPTRDRALIRVHEIATGKEVGAVLDPAGGILDGAFASDGVHVMTLSRQQRKKKWWLQCWNWRTGEQTTQMLELPSRPRGYAAGPERRVAVICTGGQVLLVDAASGLVRQWTHGSSLGGYALRNPTGVLYSPRGDTVTYGGGRVEVRDATSGRRRFDGFEHRANFAAFSSDGRLLVTGHSGKTGLTRVLDLATGRRAADLPHPDGVTGVCFSADGRYVFTACDDNIARLWEWRTGRPGCPPLVHDDRVAAVNISADGRWLFTVCHDNHLRIWESDKGKLVAPPQPLDGHSAHLFLTPDEELAIVPTLTGCLNVVHVGHLKETARAPLDAAGRRLLGEVLSGQRIGERLGLFNLTAREWHERFESFRQRYPAYLR